MGSNPILSVLVNLMVPCYTYSQRISNQPPLPGLLPRHEPPSKKGQFQGSGFVAFSGKAFCIWLGGGKGRATMTVSSLSFFGLPLPGPALTTPPIPLLVDATITPGAATTPWRSELSARSETTTVVARSPLTLTVSGGRATPFPPGGGAAGAVVGRMTGVEAGVLAAGPAEGRAGAGRGGDGVGATGAGMRGALGICGGVGRGRTGGAVSRTVRSARAVRRDVTLAAIEAGSL